MHVLYNFRSVFSRCIKVIVVGCKNTGKTTLLRRLKKLPIEDIESTVGIDIEQWIYPMVPTHKQQPITFMTWEFANQVSSVYTLNVVINHSRGIYQRSVYGIYKHPNSKNHFMKQSP